MNLTPKQLRVLEFVRNFRSSHGYAPTLEEIAQASRVSKVTILQHLRALERRGAIRRRRYQARAIELLDPPSRGRTMKVPLAGTIAAGEPIEVVENRDIVDLSELVKGKTDTFLLQVRGDSMIDEQIRNGDYVICERRTTARNGETVVAVLENGEATLKKFFREPSGRIRLQPANPSMKPIYPRRLEIRGVVIGMLRRY